MSRRRNDQTVGKV